MKFEKRASFCTLIYDHADDGSKPAFGHFSWFVKDAAGSTVLTWEWT